jgi:hypothetical protein
MIIIRVVLQCHQWSGDILPWTFEISHQKLEPSKTQDSLRGRTPNQLEAQFWGIWFTSLHRFNVSQWSILILGMTRRKYLEYMSMSVID